MEKTILIKKVDSLIHDYKNGTMYNKVQGWIKQSGGNNSELGFCISTTSSVDRAGKDLDRNFMFWYGPKNVLYVSSALGVMKQCLNEVGRFECSFCKNGTNNKYYISNGFFSRDNYYFCFICQRNLEKNYGSTFFNSFYDNGANGKHNGLKPINRFSWSSYFNRVYKLEEKRAKTIYVSNKDLIQDLEENFSSLEDDFSKLKKNRIKQFNAIVERMEKQITKK